MKIIHLSDLHIGSTTNLNRSQKIANWLLSSENESLRKEAIVLITGDIVDDGQDEQYEEAQDYLKQLQQCYTVVTVPGNHDYGQKGILRFKKSRLLFQKYINPNAYPFVEKIDKTVIIGLDSMKGEMKKIESFGAQGELGANQLRKLDHQIERYNQDQSVDNIVIALHHHPFDKNIFLILRDAEELLEVLSKYPNTKLKAVLFGHRHRKEEYMQEEKNYGIPIIYSAPSSTNPDDNNGGKLPVPIIDLATNQVICNYIKI